MKSTYLTIDPSGDVSAPGTLEVDVYVSSEFGGGYIQLADDGSVRQIRPPG